MKRSFLGVFLCLVLGFSINGLEAQKLRVVGSDFVGSALELENGEGETMDGVSVDFRFSGSLVGLFKIQEGLADVAFVLQSPENEEALRSMTSIPLGFWGVYFAVTEENPVTEVDEAAMSEILRKSRDGLKSEWGSLLREEPRWTNRLIFVTYDIEETDPSFPVLLNQFFNNEVPEKFSSMGERLEDPYLASASNLLILSQLPIPNRGLRPLAWVESGQSVGYPPSPDSLFYGDYPLRLPLLLIVRDKESLQVKAYLKELFASGRLNNLKKSGFVPVPENVQKQALLEFDLEI